MRPADEIRGPAATTCEPEGVAAPEGRRAFAALSDGDRLTYQPGLDRLRSLAVLAVMVFHTGRDWLPGGYLGVSLFFTVSGTVIGSVLLLEANRTGAVSVGNFLRRHARRLYPAAWVVLLSVAVFRVVTTLIPTTTGADITTSFLQVFNWHLIAEGQSYADLFAAPSAILYRWSLAIEEQLYLVVGIGAAVIARRSKRPAHLLGALAAVGAVVSFLLPVVFHLGVDRTYYGTDTHAGEVLVGLTLAAVIVDPTRRAWLRQRSRPIAVTGVAAAVTTLLLWRTISAGDGSVRAGLLPLTTTASALLIIAALVPAGPVWLLVQRLLPMGGGDQLRALSHPLPGVRDRRPDRSRQIPRHRRHVRDHVRTRRVVASLHRAARAHRNDPHRALVAVSSVIVLLGAVRGGRARPSAATPQRSWMKSAVERTSRPRPLGPRRRALRAPPPSRPSPPRPRRSSTPATPTSTLTPTAAGAPTTVVGWYRDSVAMTLLLATRTHQHDGPVQFADIYSGYGCGAALTLPSEQRRSADAGHGHLEGARQRRDRCARHVVPVGAGADHHPGRDHVFDRVIRRMTTSSTTATTS